MARNQSGVYSLPPGSSVSNGETAEAADLNVPISDIAQDLNTARPIVAGGTGATSASAALVNFGLTATAAEINVLDGVTATTAEINILDGVTATAAEINALDGVTTKGTELVRVADEAAGRTALGLGTASTATTGTATGNVPVLVDVGGSPGLPAVDGSNLTGVSVAPKVFNIPTWTVNGGSTIVHDMPTAPSRVTVTLVAKVAASGWAIGDEVTVGPSYQASAPGIHVGFDDLEIWVQHYTTLPPVKAGGAFMAAANDTNWSIRVRAWL